MQVLLWARSVKQGESLERAPRALGIADSWTSNASSISSRMSTFFEDLWIVCHGWKDSGRGREHRTNPVPNALKTVHGYQLPFLGDCKPGGNSTRDGTRRATAEPD